MENVQGAQIPVWTNIKRERFRKKKTDQTLYSFHLQHIFHALNFFFGYECP